MRKSCFHVSGFRDLVTAYGETVRAGMVDMIVVFLV